MPSLRFVFQALLVEFAPSSRGHVEPRQGLALGWLGSVVAGLAVVFGTVNETPADPCYGIDVGSYGFNTTHWICEWKDHKPAEYWQDYYFHQPRTPGNSGTPSCTYLYSACGSSTALVVAADTTTSPCFGIAEGSRGSHTTPYPCEWRDHEPVEYWQEYYSHQPETPGDPETPRCAYLYSTCGPSTATAIEAETTATPTALALGANYPNPFNPATTLPVSVATDAGAVDVTIYNVLGQPVRTVWNGPLAAGVHRLTWDGRDAQGQPVAAGVYLVRLHQGDHTRLRKMIKLE